jgi:hypothetical protein
MDHRRQRPSHSLARRGPAQSHRSKKNVSFREQIEALIAKCESAFSSAQTFARGRRHLLSQLLCFGRHTVTGLLRNQDRTQCDWSADYRLYSEDRFDEDKFFNQVRAEIEQLASPDGPLIAAMDDSLLRKTGRKIHGSRYQRDPMSPPFRMNLARGLRVLQISAAVRQGAQGAARLIPIDFQHAALPAKPRKDANAQMQAAYQAERAKRNINLVGRDRLAHLRRQMDENGSAARGLIVTIDGRFTNSTVLRHIPERTTLIGRVRKDSAFHFAPEVQPERGRKRKYGQRCPTPEQLLQDQTRPWETVEAYAAGQPYQFRVKTLGPVFSPMDKGAHPLRLVVVEPVPYRTARPASWSGANQPSSSALTRPWPSRSCSRFTFGGGISKSTSATKKPSWAWARRKCGARPPIKTPPLWPSPRTPCCSWPERKFTERKANPKRSPIRSGTDASLNNAPLPTN